MKTNAAFEISISRVSNTFDKNPKPDSLSWGEFCNELKNPIKSNISFDEYHKLNPNDIGDKAKRNKAKNGPGWIPGLFKSELERTNNNIDRITAIALDFDNGEISKQLIQTRLHEVEFFAHTTFSHSPEKQKWRVVIPFEKPIEPNQLGKVFNYFNSIFDHNLDQCSKKPAQLYFLPRCPFDAEFDSFLNEGKLFNPESIYLSEDRTIRTKNDSSKPNRISSNELPISCKDGERHEVFLPAVGKWLKSGYSFDKILKLGREWNNQNIDPWSDEVLISKIEGIILSDQKNNPKRYEPKLWGEIDIPEGFNLSFDGVFQISFDDKKPDLKIASPCWVSARTRNIESKSWGVLVEWIDSDNKHHKQSIPKERFHESGNKLAQDLASQGLDIIPGNERNFLKYLGQFKPESRITCVPQLGWLENPNGRLTYVLPNQVISSNANEDCIFQPEKHSPSAATIKSKGTLEDWQENISYLAQDHPYLIFCLCVSFAGPLLKAAGLEGGGFHLYGRSSHGKTTAAQLSASVWGCGSDPSEAAKLAYVRKWNTTHNGLEALAASHNDGILILDEAGTCNAKDFGKVIYDVTGGQGKVSLDADRGIRESRSWHILLLSTGEISAQQKIEEEGKTARAGQILRLMDIPIQGGVFDLDHRRTASQLAMEIKKECSNYYGTAGPAFIKLIINRFKNFGLLKRFIKDAFETANSELEIKGLEPEQARALQRLALVKVAGDLAVELGILPFEKEDIKNAIIHIRNTWLKGQDSQSYSARGINVVKEFIVRHQSRFEDSSNSESSQIRDLIGYFDKDENIYLFTTDGFKEACKGLNYKEILEDLRKKGLLRINEGHRFTYKKQISGIGRFRFYAIDSSILEYEDDISTQNSGTVGQ